MAGPVDSKTNSFGTAVQAAKQPASLRTAQAAGFRAQLMPEGVSPRVERALNRLDKALESRREPNDNAPRGYYINIEV